MIVVDSSVLVTALADDAAPGAAVRDRLRREVRLVAPQLIDIEVVSVLRAWHRRGLLEEPRAREAVVELTRFPLDRYDLSGLLERAWALRDALSAYDAAYLALAEALRCPLITGDARLAKGAEHAKSAASVEVLTL